MSIAEEKREGFYLSEDGEWVPEGWSLCSLQSLTSTGNISYGVVQPGRSVLGGIPMLRVNNLTSGALDLSDVLTIAPEIDTKHEKSRIKTGDVLLSLVGTTGLSLIVHPSLNGWNVARAIAVIKPKPEVDPNWIKYVLETDSAHNYLNGRANTTVQKTINLSDVKALPVVFPPKKEQNEIIQIILSLDDKIELLREQNETLESLAQTLFKRWFIDFNFPDENGNPYKDSGGKMIASELGEIPDGWEVKEIGTILTRHKAPRVYKNDESKPRGDTPIYEQGKEVLMGYHDDQPCFEGSADHPYFIFGDHTCVMKLIPKGFSIAPNVICLSGAEHHSAWVFYAIQGRQSFIEYRRHWMELVSKRLIVPNRGLDSTYAERINPIIDKVSCNENQVQTLCAVRDTLLPKLMRGEIRIKLN